MPSSWWQLAVVCLALGACGGVRHVSAEGLSALASKAAGGSGDVRVVATTDTGRFEAGGATGVAEFRGLGPFLVRVAVMQMADRGLLDLDAPVEDLLPELGGRTSFRRPLRMHHLLDGTSGLLGRRSSVAPTVRTAEAALVARTEEGVRRLNEPGARQAVSDLEELALMVAVERATGRRLDQYLRENVFAPLELTDAALAENGRDVHARPDELIKLLEAILAGGQWEGREILSEEGVRHLLRPPRDGRGWELGAPVGWTVHPARGGRYVEHRASDGEVSHALRLYPGLGYAVVVVGRGPTRTRDLARTVITTAP